MWCRSARHQVARQCSPVCRSLPVKGTDDRGPGNQRPAAARSSMSNAAQSAAVVTRLKYEQKCPDCGSSDFVEDFAQGDLICRVSSCRRLITGEK